VVFENEDIFGDGVNIASRIQAITEPGGIFISETVHNNISNKQGIKTKFVRTESFKNVKESIRIYEVIAYVSDSAPSLSTAQFKRSAEKSIAVLPFVNMSNVPEQVGSFDGRFIELLCPKGS